MVNSVNCQHKNTEMRWSHGELRRCVDCGAVEDPWDSGKWNDIVMEAVINMAAGNTEAAKHFTNYMKVAREYGAPYPDLSLSDVIAAGELLKEMADEKPAQQNLNFEQS